MRMTTFIDRIRIEKSDLDDKLQKLSDFIESENFHGVVPEHQGLLYQQFWIMKQYSQILQQRLDNL